MNFFQDVENYCEIGPLCGATRIITIDGRAGSGKTTLAGDLNLYLSERHRVQVLHLDEIYDGWSKALNKNLSFSLDEIVRNLTKGEPIVLQIYNWHLGVYDAVKRFDPPDVLIIEGVGSGQRLISNATAAKIWMEISSKLGLSRVLERDGVGISSEMLKWQAMEDEHFLNEKTRERADFILTTD